MIDRIYNTIVTIANKENIGYLSPAEFNRIAGQVQNEIFRNYFEDENRDKNRGNRGLVNKGHANLPFQQRQKIEQFGAIANLTYNATETRFDLPENLYYILDDGVDFSGVVIDEVERSRINYLNRSSAPPTTTFPVYERYDSYIVVAPATITTNIQCRYLRVPNPPNWTYTVVGGSELFNPGATDFQDFELHDSEENNIVIRMLSYFGINIREGALSQYAEGLKNQQVQSDNN